VALEARREVGAAGVVRMAVTSTWGISFHSTTTAMVDLEPAGDKGRKTDSR